MISTAKNLPSAVNPFTNEQVIDRLMSIGAELHLYLPMSDDEQFMEQMWAEHPRVPSLNAGGNVGSLCFNICRYLGAKEIALCGIDFGYPPNTPLEETQYFDLIAKNPELADRMFFKIKNPHLEEEWFTDIIYAMYAHMFIKMARQAKSQGIRVCNCIPEHESVLTESMTKSPSAIQRGELLLAHDGAYHPVANVMRRQYDGELIEVRAGDEPVRMTPEHPVLIRRRNRFNVPLVRIYGLKSHWVTASELRVCDIVVFPVDKRVRDRKVIEIFPQNERDRFLEVKRLRREGLGYRRIARRLLMPRSTVRKWLLTDAPFRKKVLSSARLNGFKCDEAWLRLIGYYLAEGNVTKDHGHPTGLQWTFGPTEGRYVREVGSILRSHLGLVSSLRATENANIVVVHNAQLGRWFQQFGDSAKTKHLPSWILYLPVAKQIQMMKCYFRGDGCIAGRTFTFSSVSLQLLRDCKRVLLRSNVYGRISHHNVPESEIRGRKVKATLSYNLCVGGTYLSKMSTLLGVSHPWLHKRSRTFNTSLIKGNYLYVPIQKIARTRFKGEVFNFEVESANSFVLDGLGIVHNCTGGGIISDRSIEWMNLTEYLKGTIRPM